MAASAFACGGVVNEPVQQHVELILRELRQIVAGHEWADELLGAQETCVCGLLVLLAGEAAGGLSERLLPVAAGMELMVLSMQLHDLPKLMARRPIARWPRSLDPVLIGDYLYTRALGLMARMPMRTFQAFAELSEHLVTEKMRAREETQVALLSELDYLERAYKKSAVLFATCCKMGAELGASPSEVTEALTSFGYALGMALQIGEDAAAGRLLPCTSDEARQYVGRAKASLSVLPASLAKCLLLDMANALREQIEPAELVGKE